MHDIDRTQLEANMEYQEFQGEFQGEQFEGEQFEFPGELQEVFSEGEQMELAAELLEVSNEQELNHFLGNLIRKAAGAIGSAVNSPLGQQLGGILKSSARNAALQAVPVISDASGRDRRTSWPIDCQGADRVRHQRVERGIPGTEWRGSRIRGRPAVRPACGKHRKERSRGTAGHRSEGGGAHSLGQGGANGCARAVARRRLVSCTSDPWLRSQRNLVPPRQQDHPARRVSIRWPSIPTQERCCCTRRAR